MNFGGLKPRPSPIHSGVVWKLSGLGMFFHERYLLLKEGYLAYFRKKPESLAGLQPTDRPKAKLLLSACKVSSVSPEFARKKSKNFMFQVIFTVPGKSKPKSWVFATADQDSLNRWVQSIQLEVLYYAVNPQAIVPSLAPEDENSRDSAIEEAKAKQEEDEYDRKERQEHLERLEKQRAEEERRQQELEKRKERRRKFEEEELRRKTEADEELKQLREDDEKKRRV